MGQLANNQPTIIQLVNQPNDPAHQPISKPASHPPTIIQRASQAGNTGTSPLRVSSIYNAECVRIWLVVQISHSRGTGASAGQQIVAKLVSAVWSIAILLNSPHLTPKDPASGGRGGWLAGWLAGPTHRPTKHRHRTQTGLAECAERLNNYNDKRNAIQLTVIIGNR